MRGRAKYSSRSLLNSVSLTSWGEPAERMRAERPLRPTVRAAVSMAYWVLATVGPAARSGGIAPVAARRSPATAMNVSA